jgi:hypothetical protein
MRVIAGCMLESTVYGRYRYKMTNKNISVSNVADPDPYVFGPPGSGSFSMVSGSYYHPAKNRKTLITTVF